MVMSGPVRVAAIIPAYDAARTLGAVARETVQSFEGIGTVYVVNDGSRDDTGEIARSAGATVLTHAKNAGKGRALRTGLARAAADGHAAAVTLDADGQHPPAEAKRLALLDVDPRALVLGTRDLKGAGAPRPNRISNAISNGFLSAFSRRWLVDTQCGLRRYPLPRVLEVGGRDDGYAFEAEIILLCIAAKVPLVQTRTQVLYPEDRTTHFDSVRDPMRVIQRVLRTLVSTRGITRAVRAERFRAEGRTAGSGDEPAAPLRTPSP
ncbi:MAG: glycosyltransferase family 2 protein [Polyangiaceae bacterium]|jgi:glycosyltransferase involved in cell wall biosynthesis|nr:glycosyltransferase family 2 protein [Polyangiaceae bacterium]MBK8941833.1 glycosyltransferase family 2 protein [Polyangiaceae bacterium]